MVITPVSATSSTPLVLPALKVHITSNLKADHRYTTLQNGFLRDLSIAEAMPLRAARNGDIKKDQDDLIKVPFGELEEGFKLLKNDLQEVLRSSGQAGDLDIPRAIEDAKKLNSGLENDLIQYKAIAAEIRLRNRFIQAAGLMLQRPGSNENSELGGSINDQDVATMTNRFQVLHEQLKVVTGFNDHTNFLAGDVIEIRSDQLDAVREYQALGHALHQLDRRENAADGNLPNDGQFPVIVNTQSFVSASDVLSARRNNPLVLSTSTTSVDNTRDWAENLASKLTSDITVLDIRRQQDYPRALVDATDIALRRVNELDELRVALGEKNILSTLRSMYTFADPVHRYDSTIPGEAQSVLPAGFYIFEYKITAERASHPANRDARFWVVTKENNQTPIDRSPVEIRVVTNYSHMQKQDVIHEIKTAIEGS
jgi:hypothetical protein